MVRDKNQFGNSARPSDFVGITPKCPMREELAAIFLPIHGGQVEQKMLNAAFHQEFRCTVVEVGRIAARIIRVQFPLIVRHGSQDESFRFAGRQGFLDLFPQNHPVAVCLPGGVQSGQFSQKVKPCQALVNGKFFFGDMAHALGVGPVAMRVEANIEKVDGAAPFCQADEIAGYDRLSFHGGRPEAVDGIRTFPQGDGNVERLGEISCPGFFLMMNDG